LSPVSSVTVGPVFVPAGTAAFTEAGVLARALAPASGADRAAAGGVGGLPWRAEVVVAAADPAAPTIKTLANASATEVLLRRIGGLPRSGIRERAEEIHAGLQRHPAVVIAIWFRLGGR
jgi:hypothetical protein